MSRFIVHTLAYNSKYMIETALKNFYRTTTHEEQKMAEKYLVHCHFPGQKIEELAELAKNHDFSLISIPDKNRGIAGNWSLVAKMVGMGKDDILFGFDPDVRIQNQGWLSGVKEIFEYMPDAGYVYLNQPMFRELLHVPKIGHTKPSKYRIEHWATTAWSVGGFHGRWLMTGSWPFKAPKKFYGQFELWIAEDFKKRGFNAYMAADFMDVHAKSGPDLAAWKMASSNGTTDLDYSEWSKD